MLVHMHHMKMRTCLIISVLAWKQSFHNGSLQGLWSLGLWISCVLGAQRGEVPSPSQNSGLHNLSTYHCPSQTYLLFNLLQPRSCVHHIEFMYRANFSPEYGTTNEYTESDNA